jgi:tol-pal system protein YbgF
MKIKKAVLMLGLWAATSLTSSAFAQSAVSVDAASLTQRLQRLEERLSTIENRGSGTNGLSTMADGTTGSPTGTALADMENRMSTLEHQGDQVNGGVERLSHAVEQLAKQLDLVTKDMDARLTALEKAQATKPAAAAPAAPASEASPAVSGTAPAAVPQASAEIPANLTATEHYNKAYAYLTAADYPNALKWLGAFVKKYPTDKLADNAWYWLGEVHLVQNDPNAALLAFKSGLEKFPKGAKAPANLYKMGLALQQLKQPDFAKASWQKLLHDFPQAPEAAKAKQKLDELTKTAKSATKPAPAKK